MPPDATTSSTVSVPKTPMATATYTTVAIAEGEVDGLGELVLGSARSLAVKVMTPKPRKAKKVSATLDTICPHDG